MGISSFLSSGETNNLVKIYENEAVNVATGNTLTLATGITGYKQLLLKWNFQGTDAATGVIATVRFNDDAGTNYNHFNILDINSLTGQTGIVLSNAIRTGIMSAGEMMIDVVDSGAGNVHGFIGNGYTHGNVGVNHFVQGGAWIAEGNLTKITIVVSGTGNLTGNCYLWGLK